MSTRKKGWQKKLLRLMPRAELEAMLGSNVRPWMMTRSELETRLSEEDIDGTLVSFLKRIIWIIENT